MIANVTPFFIALNICLRSAGKHGLLLCAIVGSMPATIVWSQQASPNPVAEGESVDVKEQLDPNQAVILVVGAAGAEEFEAPFKEWSSRWRKAAEIAQADLTVIGGDKAESTPDRQRLQDAIEKCQASQEPLWLVLIGHGTFDGRKAKFNMQGRDVAAAELATWLKNVKRPLVIINSASASGPFINRLSAPNRVILTASKSGYEHNFARFGDHLSAAILSGAADLDKDGQTSLLEAFLTASSRVAEFYRQDGRLATEHALLDDNGDKLGTPATFFRGVRATKAAKEGAAVDGQRASQFVLIRSADEQAMSAERRARRDALETQIAQLRTRKSSLDEDQYYGQLEDLLVELAKVLLDTDKDANKGGASEPKPADASASKAEEAKPRASKPAETEPAETEPAEKAAAEKTEPADSEADGRKTGEKKSGDFKSDGGEQTETDMQSSTATRKAAN